MRPAQAQLQPQPYPLPLANEAAGSIRPYCWSGIAVVGGRRRYSTAVSRGGGDAFGTAVGGGGGTVYGWDAWWRGLVGSEGSKRGTWV